MLRIILGVPAKFSNGYYEQEGDKAEYSNGDTSGLLETSPAFTLYAKSG